MWEYNYLEHYGIAGQKWGVRRFQNEDGTLTEAGKQRYLSGLTESQQKVFNSMDSKSQQAMISRTQNGEDFDTAYRTLAKTMVNREYKKSLIKGATFLGTGAASFVAGKALFKKYPFLGSVLEGLGTGFSIGSLAGTATNVGMKFLADKKLENMKVSEIDMKKLRYLKENSLKLV